MVERTNWIVTPSSHLVTETAPLLKVGCLEIGSQTDLEIKTKAGQVSYSTPTLLIRREGRAYWVRSLADCDLAPS
jgi:hypothetical protein